MRFQPSEKSLGFSSQQELEEFHLQLSALIRTAMVQATCRIEDPQQAKTASREVLREFCVIMRALNAMRAALPRKTF